MLLALSPLPEEIDRGYLGRVMRMNGYRNLAGLSDAITELYQVEKTAYGRSWNDLLCRVSEMPSEKFTQRHTTLPLRRGITSYFPEVVHGGAARPVITAKNTVQGNYAAAFFCDQCAQEDIAFHGMSYWRRDHQTQGQLWCAKHAVPLSCTVEPDAMLCSPAQAVSKARPIPLTIVQEAQENAFVQRYLELVAAMYERVAPLDVCKIAPVLRDRAKLRGFQANAGPVRAALISDHIRNVYPSSWLERVFPELTHKSHGVFLPQIDGALYMRKSSSSTVAYLLVLAALFDTADEAVTSLQASHSVALVSTVLQRHVQHVLPADDELIKRYISARGDISSIVQLWELPKRSIHKRLLELGLPNLEGEPGQAASLRAGLQSFYVDKRSYVESLALSGMRSSHFDALLRKCGPNLPKALMKMDKQGGHRSRKELAHSLQRLQVMEQVQSEVDGGHLPEQHQVKGVTVAHSG